MLDWTCLGGGFLWLRCTDPSSTLGGWTHQVQNIAHVGFLCFWWSSYVVSFAFFRSDPSPTLWGDIVTLRTKFMMSSVPMTLMQIKMKMTMTILKGTDGCQGSWRLWLRKGSTPVSHHLHQPHCHNHHHHHHDNTLPWAIIFFQILDCQLKNDNTLTLLMTIHTGWWRKDVSKRSAPGQVPKTLNSHNRSDSESQD